MKSLPINLMLATAVMMVASTAASAEDMKANIPFAFQAGGKVLAPGKYMIRSTSGESHFVLTNLESFESVILLPRGLQDPKREWTAADTGVLQFACSAGDCALKQIWTHRTFPAHEFPTPKTLDGKSTSLAVIRATVDKAK